MTHSYVPEKKYPLWALKYVSDSVAPEGVKSLVGNLNAICVEIGSSNPNLLTETLDGLKQYEFELKNLINNNDNFRVGFLNFLKTEPTVRLQDEEFDDAVQYISQHMQSEVGIWNEEEVIKELLKWRISKHPVTPPTPPTPPVHPVDPEPPVHTDNHVKKINEATEKVCAISDVNKAKNMLQKLIALGYDQILDTILND